MISPAAAATPAHVPTKVTVPRLRPGHVARPHLVRLLSAGGGQVRRVAAPAGFGKTAILAEWARRASLLVTWLRADRNDRSPNWLAADLVWSIDAAAPGAAAAAAAAVAAGAPTADTLTLLSSAVAQLGTSVVTVVDEWHTAAGASAPLLERLVTGAPANWQFIVATRELGPPGATGPSLTADDLRFDDDEAHRLLRDGFGLAVGKAVVGDLNHRVGGWPAGLCLAAGAATSGDAEAVLRRWDGNHPHLREYLTAEVLSELDGDTVEFLLDGALLSPCTPELCDAATARHGSAARLAALEAAGLFVAEDACRPGLYRFVPAVAAGLRSEAYRRDAGRCHELVLRAAEWSAAHANPATAIEHYLAAGRPDPAAALLAGHGYEFLDDGRAADVLRWLDAVPGDRIRAQPEFHLIGLHAAWLVGDLDAQGAHLAAARRAARRVDGARGAGISRAVSLAGAMELARRGFTEDALAVGESGVTSPDPQAAAKVRHFGVDRGRVLGALASLALWAGVLDVAAGKAVAALAVGVDRHSRVNALGVRAFAAFLGGDPAGAHLLACEAVALLAGLPAPPFQSTWALATLAWTGTDAEAEWALATLQAAPARGQWWLVDAQVAVTAAEVQLRRGALAEADRFLARARRCVAGVDQPGVMTEVVTVQQLRVDDARGTADPEAITERELAVLELLAGELTRREISRELDVSLNTVKTHLRQLYRKLGAASRVEAVEQGRTLDLI